MQMQPDQQLATVPTKTLRSSLQAWWRSAERSRAVQRGFNFALVGGATLFVVWNLSPWLWFYDTTPTGGDLGAHVWSPAYLRDALLPNLRLTGWSPDWYAGFPAFTFYMVIPSLLIVIVNVGLGIPIDWLAALGVALVAFLAVERFRLDWISRLTVTLGFGLGAAVFGTVADGRVFHTDVFGWSPLEPFTFNDSALDLALVVLVLPAALARLVWCCLEVLEQRFKVLQRWRVALTTTAAVATLLVVSVPYGVAIKVVVVAGIVTLPCAAFAAGRLARLNDPAPALMALMTLPFIFDRSFNIYGGNLLSTMAGEFAYSLGLTVAVLFIGLAVRGQRTGRDHALAAVLLALTGMLHLFAAFFALVALAAVLLIRLGRREVVWIGVVGSLAALLAAFWVLPFVWNVRYLNDMGWGKERRYAAALWHRGDNLGDQSFLANELPLQVFVVLAVLGALISVVRRIRLGLVLSLVALVFAVAFVVLPESRLWNVRILPFYYLAVYLLAGIAFAELSGIVGRWFRPLVKDDSASRGSLSPLWMTLPAATFAIVIIVALAFPLRSVPFATAFQRVSADGETKYVYGFSSVFGVESVAGRKIWATESINPGPGWLRYNFTGYEEKSGTAEYNDLVATMERVGEQYGCGRSLWEYNSERLGTYGTTMAPMLLPHWTQGCIGSMEGLYFEASATTPYHFLLQSELSELPSRAQRELPYSQLNVDKGLAGLQTLGVRYYLAVTEAAIGQARDHSGFVEIANSGPWVVFLVEDHEVVVGIEQQPVVLEGLDAGGDHWLVPAVAAWEASGEIPLIAADGPPEWPRMSLADLSRQEPLVAEAVESGDRVAEIRALAAALPAWLERQSVATTEVTDIETGRDSISFSVEETGLPVLVRSSYFPNWKARGAEGPYRVSPNLMAVVPTESEVTLTYARSSVQWIGWLATLAGLLLLMLLLGVRKFARLPSQGTPWWDFAAPRKTQTQAEPPPQFLFNSTTDPPADPNPDSATNDRSDCRLSVVVPAYCEEPRIAATIAEIRRALADLDESGELEIVIVDDGSTDRTANAARDAGASQVVTLRENQGKGAAVRVGVLASRGNTVAFTDADLAYSPEQLLPLLRAVEGGSDVVIGNRYVAHRAGRKDVSNMRRLGSRVVNLFARQVLTGRYQDTQCGCKAFRADVAKTLMTVGKINGFAFDIEVLHLAERYGYSISEVPVNVVNSDSSTVQAVRDGIRVTRDICKIRKLAKRGDYSFAPSVEFRVDSKYE